METIDIRCLLDAGQVTAELTVGASTSFAQYLVSVMPYCVLYSCKIALRRLSFYAWLGNARVSL